MEKILLDKIECLGFKSSNTKLEEFNFFKEELEKSGNGSFVKRYEFDDPLDLLENAGTDVNVFYSNKLFFQEVSGNLLKTNIKFFVPKEEKDLIQYINKVYSKYMKQRVEL